MYGLWRVVNVGVGDRPWALGDSWVPIGNRFKRGFTEECGNDPGDGVISDCCRLVTRWGGADG